MKTKRGILSLLLILAMLIAGITALFPATVSAEPEEIRDFGCMGCPSKFAIGGDTTELLFYCTVASPNDYLAMGFVFSMEERGNNPNPEIGATGCFIYQASATYCGISYEGTTIYAPAGRQMIVCRLIQIPFAEYCSWIYVRAFVTDSAGTRYSDVMKTNVLKENRGEGKPINEAIGTTATPLNEVIKDKRNIYTDVLDSGAKTFCPNEINPEGNDLLIEYSVLYNHYMVQYLENDNDPYVTARIAKENFSENSPLAWWSPCANCPSSYCTYAGGFESTAHIETPVSDDEVTTPAGMVSPGGSYADYPNIGGSDPDNPEYGWHRIGFRIHEEVTTLPTANTEAEYLITVTTYVDGVAVAKLQGPLNANRTANYLYTASYNASTGKVEYTDIASNRYVFLYRMKYKGNNTGKSKSAYCVFADAYATCGKEFVQQVERVTPVADGPHDGGYRAGNDKGMAEGDRYYQIVPDDPDYPNAFNVMSYNIQVFKNGWNGRNPAKALQTVMTESPDIVGFQEVNEPWDSRLALLARSGGYTRLEGEYTSDDFEKNEIFFKTDKFTLIAHGTLIYNEVADDLNVPNPENADPSLDTHGRSFHYAILEQKSTGKQLLVVNTHLHYVTTGSNSGPHDKVRRYELRTLLAWLEDQAENLPADQIVMGDLNAHYNPSKPNKPGTQTVQLFLNGGFERAVDAAAVTDDVGGTLVYHYTSRVNDEGNSYAFDHIFTKGNVDTAYYTVVDNPIDVNDRYPSDHVPIMARVCLR